MTVPGSVSVLIATYDRAALLAECLASLAVQRFAPGDQVLVIDNASTDDTRTVVHGAAAWFPVPLLYLYEPAAGKSNALALGLQHATGEIVALTDDDVLLAPNWIEAIRHAMADAAVALVAGRVEPRWEAAPPPWLQFELEDGYSPLASPLALVDYGSEPRLLNGRAALGANMAVRRVALDAIGGFPRSLGKLRGTLLSGEDRYVCERLREAGALCLYDPSIVVRHWVPRQRLRLTYFARWFFWSGITNAALESAEAASRVHVRSVLGVPVYLFRQMAGSLGGALGAICTGRPVRAVEHGAAVAFVLGYVAHQWRMSTIRTPVRAAGPQAT